MSTTFNDIALSSTVRANLLSLQGTTELTSRTEARLASGLKVASAVDDATAFFSAKALNDRGSDFDQKKSGIDQGVSTLSVALDATNSIDSIVREAQGLAISLKTATGSQVANLATQFNGLRDQINLLAGDATYQGLNLIAGTGSRLDVSFSNLTSSLLSTSAVDITSGISGLNIGKATQVTLGSGGIVADSGVVAATFLGYTGGNINGQTVTLIITSGITINAANFAIDFKLGSVNFQADSNTLGLTSGQTLNDGTTFTFTFGSAVGANVLTSTAANVFNSLFANATGVFSVGSGIITDLDFTNTKLSNSLSTLRGRANVLGSSVALLQTRLSFTSTYENELTGGAGKLTLADLNAEGANLVSLQTRQQLGIQSLSFAGKAEQNILSLFR